MPLTAASSSSSAAAVASLLLLAAASACSPDKRPGISEMTSSQPRGPPSLPAADGPAKPQQAAADFAACERSAADVDKCLRAALQDLVRRLESGIPSLEAVRLGRLDVPDFDVVNRTNGRLNLNFKFMIGRVTGLTDGDVSNVTVDLDASRLSLVAVEPHITFEASFVVAGKFLGVKIVGYGRCQFFFDDMAAQLRLEADRVQEVEGGRVCWDPQHFAVDVLSLGSMRMNFRNYLDSRPNTVTNFTQLLNENWRDFWALLKPAVQETFGLLFLDFSRKVFQSDQLNQVIPQ